MSGGRSDVKFIHLMYVVCCCGCGGGYCGCDYGCGDCRYSYGGGDGCGDGCGYGCGACRYGCGGGDGCGYGCGGGGGGCLVKKLTYLIYSLYSQEPSMTTTTTTTMMMTTMIKYPYNFSSIPPLASKT